MSGSLSDRLSRGLRRGRDALRGLGATANGLPRTGDGGQEAPAAYPTLPARPQARDGLHVDWHCHSTWSDGHGTLKELVEQAEARGVTLGISDHALIDNRRLCHGEQMGRYLDAMSRVPVLRGAEISVGDLSPKIAAIDDLDYVIASLHRINISEGAVHSTRYLNYRAGLYPGYRPTVRRYQRQGYFQAWLTALEATIRAWPVTIVGHFCLLPECANAAGSYEVSKDPEPDGVAWEFLDATIDLCVRHNVAIEMNSKSRVPHAAFVARALERGARFSLGSDAHQRHRAGDLGFGRELVERLGIPHDRLLGVQDVIGTTVTAGAAQHRPAQEEDG